MIMFLLVFTVTNKTVNDGVVAQMIITINPAIVCHPSLLLLHMFKKNFEERISGETNHIFDMVFNLCALCKSGNVLSTIYHKLQLDVI